MTRVSDWLANRVDAACHRYRWFDRLDTLAYRWCRHYRRWKVATGGRWVKRFADACVAYRG